MSSSAPFAAGSVSFRSYPTQGLAPTETIDELCTQAALAAGHGFDGVMTSEHHAGFAGYIPNPLQMAGFLLDAMPEQVRRNTLGATARGFYNLDRRKGS